MDHILDLTEVLLSQLRCSACKNTYQDPKALSCLHIFCKECIQSIVDDQYYMGEVPCPKCDNLAPVEENDANSLPTVVFINRLVKYCRTMSNTDEEGEDCEKCHKAKATVFLRSTSCGDGDGDGGSFVCEHCSEQLSCEKEEEGSSCKMVPLSEIKQEVPPSDNDNKPSIYSCKFHENAPRDRYCFKCRELICSECAQEEHEGHQHDPVSLIADHFKTEVLHSLDPLRTFQDDITSRMADIEGAKGGIKEQGEEIAQKVKTCFDELIAIIEERKQALLQHTKDTIERKLKVLQDQHTELQHTMKQVENYIEFVEKTTENVCSEEFISMKNNNITSEIRHLAEHFRFKEFELRETANLEVVLPSKDQVEDMCQRSSVFSVYTQTLNSKPVVQGQINKIMVNITNSDSAAKHTVVAQLRSLVDGSTVHAEILSKDSSSRSFEVSYVPRNRAQHYLSVSINDISVATHAVFVQYPPTFLGHPVRVIEEVTTPRRLAISSNGELYLTERDSKAYTIFDVNNKRMKSVSSFGGNNLIGITVDDDDNVYVTSDHKIQRFNKSGALERILGSDQTGNKSSEFNHPNGIKFHEGLIYVCDANNSRVQVFDRDLAFVKMFGSKEKSQGHLESPLDIDFDSQENIYVADLNHHNIVVFDRECAYVRTISYYGVNPGCLSRPTGVCVLGEYVYVVENFTQRVSVFQKMDGLFVCCFGSHGHQMGQLNGPVGIVIDKDGFLFVCDTQNNRLQVF